MGGNRINLSEEVIGKIKILSKEVTQKEAVIILGLNDVNQLRYICRKYFIHFRRGSKPRIGTTLEREDIPLIRALREEGVRVVDIAEKFEISTSTAYRVINGEVWELA